VRFSCYAPVLFPGGFPQPLHLIGGKMMLELLTLAQI